MKNNKKIIIILCVLIAVFSTSLVKKTFQNDTFFTIAVGNKIINEGIYTDEDFTWHEGLKYQNVRWLFDIMIASIHHIFGYAGIYGFVIILTMTISITMFYILIKQKNNAFLAFFCLMIALYNSKEVFAARAQIISFLIFILEYYFIYSLLETNKKRYGVGLAVLSILLANTHASVYPLYFVFYLPYFAEFILIKVLKNKSEDTKIDLKPRKGIKILLIVFLISFVAGMINPIGIAPYVNMFKTVNEISSDIIAEMQPLVPTRNFVFLVFLIVIIGVVAFTKIKPELPDLLYFLGFVLLSLSAIRSIFFFYLIGIFPMVKILSLFLENYDFRINVTNKQRIVFLAVISIISLLYSTSYLIDQLATDYLDRSLLPIDATEFMLDNIDVSNIKLFNGFNFGSYLEYKGIPVFLDSRAEIYIDTFNDTSILADWNEVSNSGKYERVFNKYGVDYAMLYNSESACEKLYNDTEWDLIYMDDVFSIYKKVQ